MKATKSILSLMLCGGLFFACDNNEEVPGVETPVGDPAQVTLTIVNSGPSTYALTGGEENGTTDENKVSQIEVYVFDDAGAIDTKVNDLTPDDGIDNGNGYFTVTVPSTTTTYKYTIIMSAGNDKKMVAVANMNLGAVASYNALKAKLNEAEFTASAGAGYNSRTIPSTGFEMSGEIEADIATGSANSVRIPVSRLASKINAPVFTSVAGVNTAVDLTAEEVEELWGVGAVVPNITFKGLGYALANGISKSSVLFTGRADGDDTDPTNSPWGDWSWTGKDPYLNSAFNGSGKYTSVYSGQSVAGDWFLATDGSATGENCVYAYENKAHKITVSGQTGFDPEEVYAFIIKGEFVVDGDDANANGLNQTRYWRVDLVRDNNYHILRNNSYHVYLKTITSIGWPTEQEAEEEPDIIVDQTESAAVVEVVVNKWRVNQYETEM